MERRSGVLPIFTFKGKEQLWGYFTLRGTFWGEKAKSLPAGNTCSHVAKASTKSNEVQLLQAALQIRDCGTTAKPLIFCSNQKHEPHRGTADKKEWPKVEILVKCKLGVTCTN